METEIYKLDRMGLLGFLHVHRIEFDEELMSLGESESMEILQGLAISVVTDTHSQNQLLIAELSNHFPQSADLVQFLLESVSYKLTEEVTSQLLELERIPNTIIVVDADTGCFRNPFPKKIFARSLLIVCQCSASDNAAGRLLYASLARKLGMNCLPSVPFGCHNLSIGISPAYSEHSSHEKTLSGVIFASSPGYEFVETVDHVFDRMYFGWAHGGIYSDALEATLLELLVSVNDELDATVRSWRPMMSMMGGGASAETARIVDTMRADVQSALCSHCGYAIGRLHQTIAQLQDGCGNMLQLPTAFTNASKNFVVEKVHCSPRLALLESIASVVSASLSILHNSGEMVSASQRSKIHNLLATCNVSSIGAADRVFAAQDFDFMTDSDLVTAVTCLQPNPLEMMSAWTTPAIGQGNPAPVAYLPVVPLSTLENDVELDQVADSYSEILLMDVFNIGSILGTSLDGISVQQSTHYILSLLQSGFAYVIGSGGKLMGLMNLNRSMIYLGSSADSWLGEGKRLTKPASSSTYALPLPLAKRLKEMPRIFRNKITPGKFLSLRLNSNFDLAVSKLRAHHGMDCWVDEKLESVWRYMISQSPPKLLIFELWYGDDMIAADFGHPSTTDGKAVYIATRFFDREQIAVKVLMPGFLLALAECKVLHRLGCILWDLGGVDLCPLMQYKYELAGDPLPRPRALYEFRQARALAGPSARDFDLLCAYVGESQYSLSTMNDLRSGMTLIPCISLEDLQC